MNELDKITVYFILLHIVSLVIWGIVFKILFY